ncbi:septation protein SepH [Euzebya rosea]|uniref:septation protein SepH n=1 Tax=Euzebya rosea TaxID=2052804 RepID=UPI000D3EE157|nr:septation protein SepH [Euzebya rosea]
MQALDLVGCTADMTHLVFVDPSTGERFRARLTTELITTLVEMLESSDDDRLRLLRGVTNAATHDVAVAPVDADAPSPAAALVSLGTLTVGQAPRAKLDGSASRLSPSEIQRLLRAGKAPESVAEQAGVSLDWVLRWFQPIAAEQRKVITSVLGGRQEREGFGLSDDLIGDSVRTNLLARDVEPDEDDVQWSASRPEGRPYWTVTLRFTEGERVRRATWRYDIGTGRVSPRDDLAVDLGWTAPITHPSPGRMHHSGSDPAPAPQDRAGPPPPPAPRPNRWAPPTPPSPRRQR